MMTTTKPALPAAGAMLEPEIRALMRARQYAPCHIDAAVAWVESRGTATGCDSIEPEDTDAVNALVVRHTGHIEYESAADWPSVYDEFIYNPTAAEAPAPQPEPFEPAPSDRSWWASEVARLDAEDVEFNASHAGVVDELARDDGRVTDYDVARSGAVG